MKILWNKANNNWMLEIQLHKSLLTFIDLFMLMFFLLTFLLGLELKTSPSADAQTEIAHSFWVIFLCSKQPSFFTLLAQKHQKNVYCTMFLLQAWACFYYVCKMRSTPNVSKFAPCYISNTSTEIKQEKERKKKSAKQISDKTCIDRFFQCKTVGSL